MQLGVNSFSKLSGLHSEVQPKLLQRELRTPRWGFGPVQNQPLKKSSKIICQKKIYIVRDKKQWVTYNREVIWYWFLAWHGFLCTTTEPTCSPGENNNNKSHNHCNLWQLQLPRLISSQFSGHGQTVESLSSIMGWPPVEKVAQRCINNRNGGQTRNSHPACCSLSLATQIIWEIFTCFTLLERKLAADGLCLPHHRDRQTDLRIQSVTPRPAESQGSFSQLLMDISELKMELWAGSRHSYSIFSRP